MARSWGLVLVLSAAMSYLMPAMGLRPFLILSWIDWWGSTTGWIIRGAMTLLGLWLIMRSSSQSNSHQVAIPVERTDTSPR